MYDLKKHWEASYDFVNIRCHHKFPLIVLRMSKQSILMTFQSQ